MNFFIGEFPDNVKKFSGIERHGPGCGYIRRIMAQSTDFQIGGSNTDGVFLGGQMQVGKNGHRPFWFNDSLNFVHTVQ